jgi:hypothetical protein
MFVAQRSYFLYFLYFILFCVFFFQLKTIFLKEESSKSPIAATTTSAATAIAKYKYE